MTAATASAPVPLATGPHYEELLIRADRSAVIASLARGMAHDLRGPLQTLTLIVDPHADLLAGPEGLRVKSAVAGAVQHLSDTIGRFSQVYAPVETEPSPIIVEDLLNYVVDLQHYQRGLAPAEIELRLPGGLPPIRALETPLRHILLSLILNAKESFEDRTDGMIALVASLQNGMVRLSVEDNGPGIAEGERARVFEAFHTTRPGHLGVGLTVARWLAERQGGSLTLEQSERGGVKAIVELSSWRRMI
ncbi:MAG TPA: HAMP domain-containing sensor histidine kinase [Gemmatimonadales bacterium]|nr:HAMP domain-containing sensor histidine kinase [Gemmatimonadales bacterium]